MREKTGCFTGHRHIPEKDYALIEEKLEQTIVKLYNNGIIRYCAGVLLASIPLRPKLCCACARPTQNCG